MSDYWIDPHADINGTHLLGYLHDAERRPVVSYAALVDLFGPPCYVHGDKTLAMWVLRFPDGDVATVYDYYSVGPVEAVTDWHVGGHANTNVLPRVQRIVRDGIKPLTGIGGRA